MSSMNDFITAFKGVFQGIGEFFTLKFVPSFVIPTMIFLFGAESFPVLNALLVLIVIDFITGIVSARMSGQEIKSRRAVHSAFKIAVYGLLISAGHLTEQITPGATFIEEAITTFLALTELISIIENIGKMGFAVPQKLLNKLVSLREGDKEKTS